MKQVVCINDNWIPEKNEENAPAPKMLELVTVDGTTDRFGELFYSLEEYGDFWYAAKHFAPTSSIDETTFERNYKTETA